MKSVIKSIFLFVVLGLILGIALFQIYNNYKEDKLISEMNISEVNIIKSDVPCNYSSLGYHKNQTITCCGSMSPSINNSDNITMVLINSKNNYSVGDVVIAIIPDSGLVVHRLIEIKNSDSLNPRCKTKGDNNVNLSDPWTYCSLIKWKVVCVNGWEIR